MSGGSYTIDPKTGARVRDGEAPRTPSRAERRAAEHAATAAAATPAPEPAADPKPGRRRKPAEADAPLAPASSGDLSATTDTGE